MVKKRKLWLAGGVGLVVVLFVLKQMFHAMLGTRAGSILVSVERELQNLNDDSAALLTFTQDPCRYQPPFFSKDNYYDEIHLVFFGKPIMQALKHLCIVKGWRMTLILNASEEGVKTLNHIARTPNVFTIVYTTSRTFHHSTVRHLANSTHALVSAIRYSFKVTGAKKNQLESFRSYFQKFGCDMMDKPVMPLSFMLDDTKECLQFFKYASRNPDAWWVLKTSQGYGGEGISIHSNLSLLHKKFALCNNHDQYIVQKYLPQLLLIQGRKFDVRALVLVANTNPYLLFYHEGYLRLSLEKFSSNINKGIHLTNSHIQTQSTTFSPDKHFWSFQRLQSYLDKHHPNNRKFVTRALEPFIKKVAIFILQAGLPVFERNPSSFQLLGLDFLVTDNYQVWFVEANNYPLWPKTSQSHSKEKYFIDELISSLGEDVFDLLFRIREDPTVFNQMKVGQHFKSMELIWSEIDHKCSGGEDYNPCNMFS